MTAEYEKFHVVTVYTPNAKEDLSRVPLRHDHWDPAFLAYVQQLEKKKPVVFCGDLNVAHTELDLTNPKPNRGKKGFTDEERKGFQNFVDAGFVDTFRIFTHGNGHYTWWSHFANARARNVGWRIDYVLVSPVTEAACEGSAHPRGRHGLGPLPREHRTRYLSVLLTVTAAAHIFTHMGEYHTARLDGVFNALGDPTRRAILARLSDSEARVTEIADEFPISLNSVSKHIRMLERAGLLSRTVQGRDHVISLNAAPLAEAAVWIEQYRTFWEGRLAALETYVLTKKRKRK